MASKELHSKWELRMKQQKTMFIGTVNLGHVGTELYDMTEKEVIDELEAHWNDFLTFPNLQFARGQIERNQEGNLHIQFACKFGQVIRGRTLMNKWPSWVDVARDFEAVMKYCQKTETRVGRLQPFGVKPKKVANSNPSPKALAIQWLMEGKTPKDICKIAPEVYFTHHRAIVETWKMLQMVGIDEEE